MAKLTIAIDEHTLKRARLKALQQGQSVNALLRAYLEQYACVRSEQEAAAVRLLQLSARSKAGRGRRRWTRDELHER